MNLPNKNYLTNLAAAVSGQQGFVGNAAEEEQVYKMSLSLLVIYVLFLIFFGLGAARLSYTYNVSIGNSVSVALAYAVLNFFFSSFYYPFYAFFLNPVGSRRQR
jgi:ABC-type uncharacterized transport system permease subunit